MNYPSDDITWPEGWTLEYTTDGTTWINWDVTAPSDVSAILAIRSIGDVNAVGENMFKTTATGSLHAASFNGSGMGDGYNVAVGNDKLFNFWHHQSNTVTAECHYFDGSVCETYLKAVDGYSTNHASSVYYDKTNDHLYGYVMNDSDGSYGVLCFDYSDINNVVTCGYTPLNTDSTTFDNQDMGSSSVDDGKIWSIQGEIGKLMCFDMVTQAACSPDNAWSVGVSGNSFDTGRVTAVGGKVFWTNDDRLGCYDSVTHARCAGTSDVTLTDTENRHNPFPIENTSGTFLGVCDYFTRQCLSKDATALNFPAALGTFWDSNGANNVIARQNAEQFAYANHRLYYETINNNIEADWSSTVSCYDYATEQACEGFDGSGTGLTEFYSATVDSAFPNCVFLNQNTGTIIPINATTGEVNCVLADPSVDLPYDAITPRMSCLEDGRVTAWSSLKVNIPTGVAVADVRVSFYNSDGEPVSGYMHRTTDANGVLDLTGLTTDDTGTQPTIRITAGDISDELAGQIGGTVTFVAEDPQLCFTLNASNNCESTVSNSPAPGSIADGIVEGTSITRPDSGTDVGTKERTTLPGENAADMCVASALDIELPPPQLASTGVDAGGIAIAGFAVLAAGVAAVAVTRRRKA